MTAVTLYPDQTELVARVSETMRRSKSVLMQSATGSGKTRMAANMIDRTRIKGNRCGFLVPRKSLLAQTHETLNEFSIPHGVVAAGWRPPPFERVKLISAPTLSRRLDTAPTLDIVFIDECHFGGADLDRIIQHYKSAGSWVIGLSATPMKTNGQGMGEWYDQMVCGPQIGWYIENKRLSEFRLFAPDTPDLSALRVTGGQYVANDVDSYMMSDERGKVLVGSAAKHYANNAMGLRNVSFCTSVKHAKMTAQIFNDAGIPSAAVSGESDPDYLKRVIRAFAKGEILNVCNAQLWGFGFDLAQASGVDVTIESMSDLCPSKSLPWQAQKWGRVLRMKDKPAMIFDHAGNALEHGMPDQDREWSLEAAKKRGAGGEKTEPTRQCGECYFVMRPCPTCPNCGHVFPIMGRQIEEVEGELIEVSETAPRMKKPQIVAIIAKEKGLKGLLEYAKEEEYKDPLAWAKRQLKVRRLPIK